MPQGGLVFYGVEFESKRMSFFNSCSFQCWALIRIDIDKDIGAYFYASDTIH